MQNVEKLGVFYLGREFDPVAGRTTANPLLYDARDLTTHGVIVGMTGSGKTGLAIAMLEEAALDGIPAIAIDPKGDLGNLLLSFPDLKPADFRPWVDEAEAARRNLTPDDDAARTAETWRRGLAEWGQDGTRIRRFREAVDLVIYTPGSSAGRPLQLLRSFAAPAAALLQDPTALRDRVVSAVSGLLGLLGLDADPLQSRPHILLSSIMDRAWRAGRSLDIAALIADVQKPPFDKIGVFDLESFYPAKERFGLAMTLNNLLASPGFSSWMEGDPLDIQRLLYTPEGRPRLAILSIAHLSDAERMFFVTILLNEVLAWVRLQSGTGSLRALLYMDEIFGYFPPNANPPSKTPMLTLLKQARAYGLGVLLSTQNPVDLDYKGLANAGTWWIGRLQTERDKLRVIEGLEGAAAGGSFDRGAMERLLAGLGSRVFLMRNVHDDQPLLFHSRWALSYLRGPMTLPQIRQVMQTQAASAGAAPAAEASRALPPTPTPAVPSPPGAATAAPTPTGATRPVLPPEITEYFRNPVDPTPALVYRPAVIGIAKLHYVNAKSGLDTWVTRTLLAPLGADGAADWGAAQVSDDGKAALAAQPLPGATFGALPAGASQRQAPTRWQKTLRTHLHEHGALATYTCPTLKLSAKPEETEGDFHARVAQTLHERRDAALDKVRDAYRSRLRILTDRIRSAEDRLQREKSQASQQKLSTVLGVGATLLGALLGRRAVSAGNVGRATSTLKNAGRIGKEQADVARAGESLEVLKQRLAELELQFEEETAAVQTRFAPATAPIERSGIPPRKADMTISTLGLCWTP